MESVLKEKFQKAIKKELVKETKFFKSPNEEIVDVEISCINVLNECDEDGNGKIKFKGEGNFTISKAEIDRLTQTYTFEGYAIVKDFMFKAVYNPPIIIYKK